MPDVGLLDSTRARTLDPPPRRRTRWAARFGVLLLVATAGGAAVWWLTRGNAPPPPASPPPPSVTVSTPLQRTVQASARFLGQFSAVDTVELRAQVGGTLTQIGFRDGQIVRKGDQLFTIDPRPFEIRREQASAQLQTALAKQTLGQAELWRAQQLKATSFGTAETVDQRAADLRSAQADAAAAQSAIADAELDLEFSRIAAPFTGRIGARQVSVGSLVSGSRGGTSATTLLATVVSLDPIYLDFDMSEADFAAWQKSNPGVAPHADVAISLGDSGQFDRHGTLDFIDNVVDRSSGTIHARATVPNPSLSITPGQFARLRLALGDPEQVLLVPAAAVVPDQSRQVVMTVATDNTVSPKLVEIGDVHDGLRVIRSGLAPTDRVVIDGIVRSRPGAKVTPIPGTIAPDLSAAAQ
ncbi:MAG: efflux RND transporter periplasmic adaptor subunit [Acidisphaera sp.]|nr:efflux RND transporter periplasmic adaptor subunit [Acidisphaera sp.]MBV9812993.1 efflux RND transporter periplasmic adaptor subunit [Acetobacteraceae bacterium]